MKFHYTPPRQRTQQPMDFSLDSLRFLALAVDERVPQMLLKHAKGSDLTPDEEAKAIELHQNARDAVLRLLDHAADMENPVVFLAMAIEKYTKGAL